MLALPSKGFAPSITRHNVDYDICCDWLEATTLFLQSPVTGAQVVDLLCEQQVYEDQDFAWELFDLLCEQMKRRSQVLGDSYPLNIKGKRIIPKDKWKNFIPYSFCLILSAKAFYPKWAAAFGQNYIEQGTLFEKLSAKSFELLLPNWEIHQTGWGKASATKLKKTLQEIADKIGEEAGNLNKWAKKGSNDAGLDVICVHSFKDERGGHISYLIQCASGENWPTKLHKPCLNEWKKLIDFSVEPRRGFSMPYALSDKDFRYYANIVQGIFLDRYRLLVPGYTEANWVPNELSKEIGTWLTPRIKALPLLN